MRPGSRKVTLFTTSIQLAGSIDQADVVGLIRFDRTNARQSIVHDLDFDAFSLLGLCSFGRGELGYRFEERNNDPALHATAEDFRSRLPSVGAISVLSSGGSWTENIMYLSIGQTC
jgi:hypothetical protein